MLNIDGFAYTNRLRQVHPLEKAAFAFITMFLCIGFSLPVFSCIIILLMAYAIIGLARIPMKVYLKLMSLPLSFLSIGVLTIAVSISTHGFGAAQLAGITISGINIGITHSGLHSAAGLFFKSLGAVSCLYFLSLTTPAVEIVDVMRKLKIPALFIELTDLIYRFIFVMLATAEDIYTSQSSRWGYASLKNSMKSLGQLTAALFIKAYHRSQTLFTALSSRGYNGRLNVLAPEYTVSVINIVIIAIVESTLAITAILLEMGKIG
ncbi:cobalt ECF transporter T component CbiQ [Desulfotruncus alcoholivorax]|uniref:cobalt ECF transporter T component CbiQ n=1 Tax=Desulfotruncus alcoholivorax TaxID=265477 RepID=UPI0003F79B61|nr:cobalt ECF transporter T component CbiQ [Desulfotruncus alcoholivorax]